MASEVKSKVKAVFAYGAQSSSSVVTGTAVDTRGFTHLELVVNLGLIAATGTGTHKLQESADNSTFTDITGASFTQTDGTDDNTLMLASLKLEANGIERYVRVVSTYATAATLSSACYLLTGDYNPPNESAAQNFDL